MTTCQTQKERYEKMKPKVNFHLTSLLNFLDDVSRTDASNVLPHTSNDEITILKFRYNEDVPLFNFVKAW